MIGIKTKEKVTKDFIMNHDAFIRRSMAKKEVATEFFEANLPEHILREVDLQSLKLEKSDFVDRTLGKGIVDLLFSVKWDNELGYISILLEAQSSVDELMPFRVMKYMLQVCDLHITKNKGTKLPVIYPLILYSGTKPYTAPKSFWDMFSKPILAKQFFTDPFYLLSLRDIENIDLRHRYHSGIVLYMMREIWGKDILPHLQSIKQLLRKLSTENLHFVEDVLRYAIDNGESKYHDSVIKFFEETVPKKYKGRIMTIREEIERKGVEKGVGKAINNMLNSNMSVENISKIMKLSPQEVEKYKNKMH